MFPNPYLKTTVHPDDEDRRPGSTLTGRWRNRLGSTMSLHVDDHHRVRGIFHTGPEIGDPAAGYEVVGFAEGDDFAFCVDFGPSGSVASWTGHHINDEPSMNGEPGMIDEPDATSGRDMRGDRLITVWHLAQPVDNPHSEVDTWRAILTGGDEFHRID